MSGEDYETFDEASDNQVRAKKLDEALDIITGLWKGKPFQYKGRYFKVKRTVFLPPAKQKPRIPIWVGGFWPHRGPFRRAARWDGVIPLHTPSPIRPSPKDLRSILAYVKRHREAPAAFDTAIIGWGTGTDRVRNAKKIQPYLNGGMTWWLESLYSARDSPGKMLRRIRQGPPRI